ncbi:hypothetical protein FO519_002679 [Halicephalobus sp. NKZ332]|nr:hypothetical protein FO519_002679 [Halicephalobus sp. NKZ332]
MAEHKWGVICSAPYTSSLQDDIYDFFHWLLPQLTDASEDINEFYKFNERESFYFRCDPANYKQLEKCYDHAALEYPEVVIVFQILPYRNSKEVGWCKELSEINGQFVQCVLHENIYSKFANVPMNAVCRKMVTYIQRRFEELHNTEYGPKIDVPRLVVNPFEKDKPTETGTGNEEIKDVVRLVLHNYRFTEEEVASTIVASGYPPCYTTENIASIFGLLNIQTIQPYRPSAVFVQFLNDDQAIQALLNLHRKDLGSGYYLDLKPRTKALGKKLKEARELWEMLGLNSKFPFRFGEETTIPVARPGLR